MSKARTDEYSPFRRHLIRSRHSAKRKKISNTLTLIELKQVWDRQNGKCIYTGWDLDNYTTTDKRDSTNRPNFASLDRIDSALGYDAHNVQFICMIAQFAKNNFSEDDFIKFVKHSHDHLKNQKKL